MLPDPARRIAVFFCPTGRSAAPPKKKPPGHTAAKSIHALAFPPEAPLVAQLLMPPCLTFSQVQSARNRLVGSAADPGDEALFLKNGR